MATELGSRGTPETDLKEPIEALLTVVPQLARSIDTLNKSVTRIDRNVSTLDSNVTMLRTSLEAMVGCFTATVEVFVDRTNEQAAAFRRVHDIYTGFVEDQRRGGQTTKTVHKLLNLDYGPDNPCMLTDIPINTTQTTARQDPVKTAKSTTPAHTACHNSEHRQHKVDV